MVINNLIKKSKFDKYYKITKKALEIAKKSIIKKNEKKAQELIYMVECYIEDSEYFKEKGDFVNSFACINYAHGWLDCGARLKIFDVNDNKLFSV